MPPDRFIQRSRLLIALCWLGAGMAAIGADRMGRPERATSHGDWLLRSWETEDGLPENSATSMVQSADGYLWFGTFNGLVRFDGNRFTVLNPVNTPGLPSAAIVNLHRDRTGRMWISTDRGLATLTDRRWHTYGTNEGWVGNYVRTFAERSNGDLLITTFDGHVLEFANNRLQPLPPAPGDRGNGYFGHADENGLWWVIQNRFIGRWDSGRWVEAMRPTGLQPDQVGAGTGRDGALLLVVKDELQRWRKGQKMASIRLAEAPGAVWGVSEDHAGNVWISTYDRGLCQVRPDGGFQRLNAASGLSYDNLRGVVEDVEHNLWIGSSGGGLMRLRPRRFQVFADESGLSEHNVFSVSPGQEDTVWMATYGKGLFRKRGGKLERVALTGYPSDTVYAQCVLQDHGGSTWLGTYGQGLWRFDGAGNRRLPGAEVRNESVASLFEDSRGRLWFGGNRRLGYCEGDRIQLLGEVAGSPLPGVVGIAEDQAGRLWFCNADGVFRWDGRLLEEVRREGGQPLRDILCFRPNPDGSVWMGSRNEGLLHWASGEVHRLDSSLGYPATGVHAIIADDLGNFWMPSRAGVVRVSASDLVAVVEGRSARIACQLLDYRDGLLSVDCPAGIQPVCSKDSQGRLWFATLKGAARIDPAAFRLNARPPPVMIESVSYRDRAQAPAPGMAASLPAPAEAGRGVANQGSGAPAAGEAEGRAAVAAGDASGQTSDISKEIIHRLEGPFESPQRIRPGAHGIEIRYTAPSLTAPEKVQFQVRLEPEDRDWQSVGFRRVAYYHDLAPGTYVFRVRAANNDGVWNEAGDSLRFLIEPFFWQTRWFGLLIGGMVIAAASYGYRRSRAELVARSKARALFARQLIVSQEKERSRVARELHDDITQRLARLALDAGQVNDARLHAADREVMAGLRESLSRLIEDVHALSYQLHSSVLEDLGLADGLRAECERYARSSTVTIDFKVGTLPGAIPADQSICLFRVAQEALRNVVRHANARRVQILLRGLDGGVQLAIQDDGVGFDPTLRGRRPSLGLTGMRERLELLGGHLDIETAPQQGTAIVAWLPLKEPGL